jgi:anti-anti-sigma factor
MLHHSLCSATGIPHSTQIRTRGRGAVFFEKSFFRKDMLPETRKPARRFADPEKLAERRIIRLGEDVSTMTIEEHRFGDVTLLHIAGRIVFGDGAQQLREYINNLIDQARLKFLLDLREVTYIDSFGVGVIAAKYVSVTRKGGNLKLVHPSARSHRVMKISGLMRIFECFETAEEGVRSFE